MANPSPAPIGAPPDTDWKVESPAEGEWLIAVAVPEGIDLPENVSQAVEQLLEALGTSDRAAPSPLCRYNVCEGNNDCKHQCGYKRK
jgi:hypothetical protein